MSDETQKKIFSKNLNSLIRSTNKTQKEIADAIGVIPQTFNSWCTGQALPRMGKVQALADYFNILKSDLIEEKQYYSQKVTKGIEINVLGRVAAGIPISAIEYIVDTEEISEELARNGEYFGLQIKGDSMEPRICDGDVVIVRQQDDADSGDIIIAVVNGNDATCKRLIKYESSIALISFNSKYEPMMYTLEDVECVPVRIIGKVVELRRKI